MVEIVVPSPGESISEVTLGAWHKQDGDWVETDEVLVDIESDKATLEVRAPAAGVLRVKGSAGSDQKVGAAIAAIDTKAARPAGAAQTEPKATAGAGSAAKPAAAAAASSAAAAASVPGAAPAAAPSAADAKASSVAKKMAADKGIDLATVPGSGPAGRVMKADIERAATGSAGAAALAMPVKPVSGAGTGGGAQQALAARGSRGVRREKMPKIRQRIAERLVEAQHNAAMLTTFNECDMTEVMRLRTEHKEAFEKRHGVGLGFMSFFVSAACSALKRFPKVNGYIAGDEIEYHDYCDVSVAVGTDRGLVVPVLRNAEGMTFAAIERTIKDFALRARDGKLGVDEMTGGTFTITNGGIYGSLMSTPILNAPQSAILGMHAIKKRAVEDPRNPGQVALRPMMYLALSYDHRIIDGAEAVSFLVHIKDCIEKPERLLLD